MVGSDYDLMREQILDAHDVRYAILLGQELRPMSTLPDADDAAALAAAYNDMLCERWLARDPRLLGAILVATQDPQGAAREIRRTGARREMVEVLLSDGAPMPHGRRYYDPIHQACAEVGLPVAIHTGSEGPSPVGWGSYPIEHRQARPMGYMAHLASMVFEGLWERFPTLQVVFIEGGDCIRRACRRPWLRWLPTYLWRLDSDWRGLRRFREWVGYGPKTLQRILRLQRLLLLAEGGAGALGDLAVAAGYADQAHMTREVGALAGITPRLLVAAGGATLGMSDLFKTGPRAPG